MKLPELGPHWPPIKPWPGPDPPGDLKGPRPSAEKAPRQGQEEGEQKGPRGELQASAWEQRPAGSLWAPTVLLPPALSRTTHLAPWGRERPLLCSLDLLDDWVPTLPLAG